MDYDITGGDHGNYQITRGNSVRPCAFVRRNQSGGGYTVEASDRSKSVQMRNMPVAKTAPEQAAMIVNLLNGGE